VLPVAIISVLLVAVVALYFYFDSQTGKVIEKIKANNLSTTIEAEYDALTPIGQALFREEIVDAFVAHVSANAYAASETPVNAEALDNYAEYKKTAEILGVSSADGTNVVEHINAVLKLEKYRVYNGVYGCIGASAEHFLDCVGRIEEVPDCSSAFSRSLTFAMAATAIGKAVEAAEGVSTGDALCNEYIAALKKVETQIDACSWTSIFAVLSVTDPLEEVVDFYDEIGDEVQEGRALENSIPAIKK
jgi:hypothetical protein